MGAAPELRTPALAPAGTVSSLSPYSARPQNDPGSQFQRNPVIQPCTNEFFAAVATPALWEMHHRCLNTPNIAVVHPKMLSPTFPLLTLPGNNPMAQGVVATLHRKPHGKLTVTHESSCSPPGKARARTGPGGPEPSTPSPPTLQPPTKCQKPRDGSFLLGSAGHVWGCAHWSWEQVLGSPGMWRN